MGKMLIRSLFAVMLLISMPQQGFCGYDKEWESFSGGEDIARWLSNDGLFSSNKKTMSEFFNMEGSEGKNFTLNQQFNFYFSQPQENNWYLGRKNHDRHFNLLGQHRTETYFGGHHSHHRNRGGDWSGNWGHMDHHSWSNHHDIKKICGPVTTVPEPISSTLFLLGGSTLAMSRLRKNKKVS